MQRNRIIAVLCSFLMTYSLLAQPATTVFTEANLEFKKGMELYDRGIFGLAQQQFELALAKVTPTHEPNHRLLGAKAGLFAARCAIQLGLPDGEKRILNYIRDYSPDPVAGQAVYEMGNYYFNAGEYDKANEFYGLIEPGALPLEKRNEVKFRQGYAYFVKKQFAQAKGNFRLIKDSPGEYQSPANYYYAMTTFFEANYDEAIRSFQKIADEKKYRDFVPYYLTQIYFAQKNYDKVINYGEDALKRGGIRNDKEISQLVGQAYFEKDDFKTAVKYLEDAAQGAGKMREEDFYQLGFAQYKTGSYKKAIANFEQLNKTNNKLGQNALFLLGDCYIKTNNKNAARNAFGAASRMDFDKAQKEEALYNYAKLSYELNYAREAVTALQQIPSSSKYHTDAQELLGELFLNSRDYEQALNILENLPNKSPKLKETYQKVCLYRGIQLYKDNNMNEARAMFNKSLENPLDALTTAQANFWLGDIAFQNKSYDESIKYMNKFLTQEKALTGFPDASSEYTANYTIGYAYLKQKNYSSARTYFQDCVTGIKRDASRITDPNIENKVLGDAVLRAGDCYFKGNKYDEALKNYDEAVSKQYPGYVYALYQKAVIEGIRGKTVDKLLSLDKLVAKHPDSEYADDALLQQGITYQQINQLDKATKPLKELVTNYKGKSDLINQAYLRLGLISFNQGSLNVAADYYKKVFSNNPSQNEAKEALAALEEIYVENLGKPDEYTAFLETVPGYSVDNMAKDSINFKAAQSQFENGNYEKAITNYTAYLNKYPNGTNALEAHFNRGESYITLKNYTEALLDYEWIIAKGTSKYYAKALNKAGIISYNHSKNFNKSYEYYSKLEKVATLETTKFDAQVGAMQSAYRTDRIDAVYEYAGKVVNNPKADKDQLSIANYYLARVAMDKKDYAKAATAYTQVAKLSEGENGAEARYQLANIDYLNRNLDRALEKADDAAQKNSDYPVWVARCIILQADIYAEKNDLFNARAALEAVVENFSDDAEVLAEAKSKLKKLEGQESKKTLVKPAVDTDLEMEKGE